MIKYFNDPFLSDCKIQDINFVEYHCHSILLANSSERFKKFFEFFGSQPGSTIRIPIDYINQT